MWVNTKDQEVVGCVCLLLASKRKPAMILTKNKICSAAEVPTRGSACSPSELGLGGISRTHIFIVLSLHMKEFILFLRQGFIVQS